MKNHQCYIAEMSIARRFNRLAAKINIVVIFVLLISVAYPLPFKIWPFLASIIAVAMLVQVRKVLAIQKHRNTLQGRDQTDVSPLYRNGVPIWRSSEINAANSD